MPSQVVDGVDGWASVEGGVASMMVVVVEPAVKAAGSFGFGAVGAHVGPFVGQGPVEAFDFAVGLGAVGADAAVFDVEVGAQSSPGVALVARAAVGEERLDGDAVLGEPAVGAGKERDTFDGVLGGEDLAVGEAGVGVDSGVDEQVAE